MKHFFFFYSIIFLTSCQSAKYSEADIVWLKEFCTTNDSIVRNVFFNNVNCIDGENLSGWISRSDRVTWKTINKEKRIFKLNLANISLKGTLDVSTLTELNELNCSSNNITTLKIGHLLNLEYLNCSNNLIEELNLDSLDNIKEVFFSNNSIYNVNLDNKDKLEKIICENNRIEQISIHNAPNLNYLDCQKNRIKRLELEGKKLSTVLCNDNLIESLDIKNVPNLSWLDCSYNRISHLPEMRENMFLTILRCQFNSIPFVYLPEPEKFYVKIVDYKEPVEGPYKRLYSYAPQIITISESNKRNINLKEMGLIIEGYDTYYKKGKKQIKVENNELKMDRDSIAFFLKRKDGGIEFSDFIENPLIVLVKKEGA